MCSSRMRRWATCWAYARSTRSSTPCVRSGSPMSCAATLRPALRMAGSTSGRYSSPCALSESSICSAATQRAAVERVHAGVDLADLELLGRRVAGRLGLGHAQHRAVAVADDAPVGARLVELHRRHRGRRAAALVRLDQGLERLGGEQRDVAVDDHDRRRRIEQRGGGRHGVARALRLLLDRDLDALGQMVLEPPLRVVDHDHPPGPGVARRLHRPRDQRSPAQRVEDLRRCGAHAGALAGGEDHDGGFGHAGIVVSARGAVPAWGVV